MSLSDAAVGLGVILWLVAVAFFVRLRWLIRKRHPAAWVEHGTPLFVPILDPRRWSRDSTEFWWSGYRDLDDSDIDQAMWICRVSFALLLLIVLAVLLLALIPI
jgi:cobalamin biosynthesis protein CobD/CbiB